MHSRFAVALVPLLAACHGSRPDQTPAKAATAAADALPLDQLSREEFNFRAAERYLPLFWRADENADRAIQPAELAVLWGPQKAKRLDYVDQKGFTPAFHEAYRAMLKPFDDSKLDAKERRRRELVRQELRNGKPTLIETDLALATEEERQVAARIFAAAVLIEQIHAKQLGTATLAQQVPVDDAASRQLFFRNQGPFCVTPQLQGVAECNALPVAPPRLSGLYPASIQSDPKFCDALDKQPNGKELKGHFSTVVAAGNALKAVPYSEAYAEEMKAIAVELDAAAAAISSAAEAPFKAYLVAAAQSFRSNDWEPANVAWQRMGGSTSRWYLRIAPDEVYYEPCAIKAGFFVGFARINPDSKIWQDKLAPVKGEMEKALAQMAGPPYKARNVQFKLPDFIDMVLNAGDSRDAHGGTIGQSLPNWGPVAESGGRTVAMTNLYTDSDSRQTLKRQMSSLYCPATDAKATTDPRPGTMSTVLHEAAHNLGPTSDYAVGGKKPEAAFGGPLASTMEELKAQTSALFFADWLVDKKVLSQTEADEAHVRDVAWAFGHISRGMYDGDGKPRNYSQLASIQLGTLFRAGALVWKPTEAAANGTDQGCFELDLTKWRGTVEGLESRVLKIKSRGDRKDAEALKASFADAKDEWSKLREVITERWLRAPKATFVYSVR